MRRKIAFTVEIEVDYTPSETPPDPIWEDPKWSAVTLSAELQVKQRLVGPLTGATLWKDGDVLTREMVGCVWHVGIRPAAEQPFWWGDPEFSSEVAQILYHTAACDSCAKRDDWCRMGYNACGNPLFAVCRDCDTAQGVFWDTEQGSDDL